VHDEADKEKSQSNAIFSNTFLEFKAVKNALSPMVACESLLEDTMNSLTTDDTDRNGPLAVLRCLLLSKVQPQPYNPDPKSVSLT